MRFDLMVLRLILSCKNATHIVGCYAVSAGDIYHFMHIIEQTV